MESQDVTMVVVMAMGGVQVLILFVVPIAGWYLRKQVDRLDRTEERVGKLEAADQVFDVRLSGAPTTEVLRSVMKEELDRALKPIHTDLGDLKDRVRGLEQRT